MTPSYTVLVYNQCGTCQKVQARFKEAGIEPVYRAYLDEPLSLLELVALHRKLGIPAWDMVRKKGEDFERAGLTEQSAEEEILGAIAAQPILLQRPIVIKDDEAIIARPAEKLADLISS